MRSRAGETPPEQLLEQTITHCRKLSIAKKEKLELEELCTTLNNQLSPNQSNYNDLKSSLVEVEGQLAAWSNYNFFMRWIKRGTIKNGIRGFIQNLNSIASTSSPIPPISEPNRPRPRHTRRPSGNHLVEPNPPSPVKRLNGDVTRKEGIPFAEGRYCEVWIGLWNRSGGQTGSEEEIGKEGTGTKKVALKVVKTLKVQEKAGRVDRTEGTERAKRAERARKGLESEILRWPELHHPNILPFYGRVDIGNRLYMVFPWRENGHLLAYVKDHPEKKKYPLLRGSAAGLNYLHSMKVVHGNVRCNNVFISDKGEPQICDFGIAKIFHEAHENTVSKTMSPATNVRYAAPELIEHNNFSITTHSDTYSFALLILECITEVHPFSDIPRDATVIHSRIGKKQSPNRPDGIPDDVWGLMNRCWVTEPELRPSMDQVHRFFLDLA